MIILVLLKFAVIIYAQQCNNDYVVSKNGETYLTISSVNKSCKCQSFIGDGTGLTNLENNQIIANLKQIVLQQQQQINTLNMTLNQLITPWQNYTPILTSDGYPAGSKYVRGNNISYKVIGNTVFLKGQVVIGEGQPGLGGTFIKISLPIGLQGKQGINQIGIGSITGTGQANILAGTWGIETADLYNLRALKMSNEYFTDNDVQSGHGFVGSISGQYEI